MPSEAEHPWRREPGTEPCSAPHCGARDAVRCGYHDSGGARCRTAWCAEHRDSVDHVTYCRRHAGVMRALSPTLTTDLPGLDNRAPALVNWVARLIDHDVRTLVSSVVPAGTRVLSTRVVPERRDGARVWVRRWAVMAAPPFDVSLAVSERDDTILALYSGSSLLFSAEPPWITARSRGERLSEAQARAVRAVFLGDLLAALARELIGRRARRAEAEPEAPAEAT